MTKLGQKLVDQWHQKFLTNTSGIGSWTTAIAYHTTMTMLTTIQGTVHAFATAYHDDTKPTTFNIYSHAVNSTIALDRYVWILHIGTTP